MIGLHTYKYQPQAALKRGSFFTRLFSIELVADFHLSHLNMIQREGNNNKLPFCHSPAYRKTKLILSLCEYSLGPDQFIPSRRLYSLSVPLLAAGYYSSFKSFCEHECHILRPPPAPSPSLEGGVVHKEGSNQVGVLLFSTGITALASKINLLRLNSCFILFVCLFV